MQVPRRRGAAAAAVAIACGGAALPAGIPWAPRRRRTWDGAGQVQVEKHASAAAYQQRPHAEGPHQQGPRRPAHSQMGGPEPQGPSAGATGNGAFQACGSHTSCYCHCHTAGSGSSSSSPRACPCATLPPTAPARPQTPAFPPQRSLCKEEGHRGVERVPPQQAISGGVAAGADHQDNIHGRLRRGVRHRPPAAAAQPPAAAQGVHEQGGQQRRCGVGRAVVLLKLRAAVTPSLSLLRKPSLFPLPQPAHVLTKPPPGTRLPGTVETTLHLSPLLAWPPNTGRPRQGR